MRRNLPRGLPAQTHGGVMPSDEDAPEAWQTLLTRAFELIDAASSTIGDEINWSLGGGTVLMMRIRHRRSKDIDIFIDDQQLLGLFNPRISDAASEITTAYDEGAQFVKLFLPQGEIDIVAASALTTAPVEAAILLNRALFLERSAEIIAKKMWHRGNLATARDLLDLVAVAESQPDEIEIARPYFARHGDAFLALIDQRQELLRAEFDAIDRLNFDKNFDECRVLAHSIINSP